MCLDEIHLGILYLCHETVIHSLKRIHLHRIILCSHEFLAQRHDLGIYSLLYAIERIVLGIDLRSGDLSCGEIIAVEHNSHCTGSEDHLTHLLVGVGRFAREYCCLFWKLDITVEYECTIGNSDTVIYNRVLGSHIVQMHPLSVREVGSTVDGVLGSGLGITSTHYGENAETENCKFFHRVVMLENDWIVSWVSAVRKRYEKGHKQLLKTKVQQIFVTYALLRNKSTSQEHRNSLI